MEVHIKALLISVTYYEWQDIFVIRLSVPFTQISLYQLSKMGARPTTYISSFLWKKNLRVGFALKYTNFFLLLILSRHLSLYSWVLVGKWVHFGTYILEKMLVPTQKQRSRGFRFISPFIWFIAVLNKCPFPV